MAYVGELSNKKLRRKLGETLNESASAPTSAFAQRQLEKMGWTQGTGLGKKGTGRTSHIRVTKRNDQEGLGVAKADLERQAGGPNNEWWKDNVGSTLARLSSSSSSDSRKKKKDKKKKKSKTQPKEYTDEELFQATGGARFGMRAQRRAEGKWKRTESNLDEDTAKGRVEWNGLGSAKLLLTNESSSKKKRQRDDDKNDQKDTTTTTEESTDTIESNISEEDADKNGDELTREKKRRKKEKKKEQNESPENNHVIMEKKKKKKDKK